MATKLLLLLFLFFCTNFNPFSLVRPAILMFYLEHMTLRFVSVLFFLVFFVAWITKGGLQICHWSSRRILDNQWTRYSLVFNYVWFRFILPDKVLRRSMRRIRHRYTGHRWNYTVHNLNGTTNMWLGSQGTPECCQDDANCDETHLSLRMMFEVQKCLMFSSQGQLSVKANVK